MSPIRIPLIAAVVAATFALISSTAATPVADFQFSEGSGDTVTDTQANNTGVLAPLGGGRFSGGVDGKFGGALFLEHPTGKAWSGHTNFAQFDADFDQSSEGAVSFFVNHNTVGQRQAYIAGGAGDMEVEMHSGSTVFSVLDGDTTFDGGSPQQAADNMWSHVVVNWGGGTHEVLVDGVSHSLSSNAGPTTLNEAIRIGRRFTEDPNVIRPIDAGIDDLAFYSAPLDSTARSNIASGGAASETTNLLVHWNLDDAVGATLASSNNGSSNLDLHVGEPIGSGVSFNPGGGPNVNGDQLDALDFDGASELSRVIIPDSASLDFNKTDGTIAMWVKLDADGQRHTFLKTTDESLELQVSSSGQLFAAANDDNDSGNRLSSQSILSTDGWTHIAFIWDQTNGTQDFYVNGVFDAGASGGNGTWAIPDTADWVLGNDPIVPERHLDGSLAGLYLFDRVLTLEEIEVLAGIAPQAAIPEPSTLILAGLMCVLGLGLRRPRQRRAG